MCRPPEYCVVDFPSDCPTQKGCIIEALVNQTGILKKCVGNQDHSKKCSNALKYLVHFIGDITQPLHCSGLAKGGTETHIKFDGRRRGLHAVKTPSKPPSLAPGFLLTFDPDLGYLNP